MAEKRYFWLKVSKEFFEDKVIKKLRKLPGGDTYALIALRILLRALESDFRLYFEGVEKTFAAELALDLTEDEEAVEIVINALVKYGWLQAVDEETIYSPKAEQMCGSETQAAQRMRKMRENKAEQKLIADSSDSEASHCYADVTDCYKNVTLDIEIEKEKDIDNSLSSLSSVPSCAETEAPEEVFIELPLVGGKKARITEQYCNDMQELYQAIDVREEIRKAKAWLISNPKRSKTNWRRFIGNWLASAQDKAGKRGATSSKTSNANFEGMSSGRIRL